MKKFSLFNLHYAYTLASVCLIATIALSSCSSKAIISRVSILEKKVADNKNRRVVIYHDLHKPNKALTEEQMKSLLSSYNEGLKLGETAFLIEAPPLKYKGIFDKRMNTRYKLSKEISSLYKTSNYPMFLKETIGAILDTFSIDLMLGNSNDHILWRLSDISDQISFNYLDSRVVLGSIHDLIAPMIALPLCIGTNFYNIAKREISGVHLSVEDYFIFFDKFIKDTRQSVLRFNSYAKNAQIKNHFKQTVLVILDHMEGVTQWHLGGTKEFLSKNVFDFMYKRSDFIFTGILPKLKASGDFKPNSDTDYLVDIWSDYWYYLVRALEKLYRDFIDIKALEYILSPNSADRILVAVGMLHGDTIIDTLREEGYTLLYDSQIRKKDGNRVNNYKAEWLDLNRQDQGHPYEVILPLDKKIYSYAFKNRQELYELFIKEYVLPKLNTSYLQEKKDEL